MYSIMLTTECYTEMCSLAQHAVLSYKQCQGYKHQEAFIITQGPMQSTARDFWKMVYDRKCGVIVMLSDLVEEGQVRLVTALSTESGGLSFPVSPSRRCVTSTGPILGPRCLKSTK